MDAGRVFLGLRCDLACGVELGAERDGRACRTGAQPQCRKQDPGTRLNDADCAGKRGVGVVEVDAADGWPFRRLTTLPVADVGEQRGVLHAY